MIKVLFVLPDEKGKKYHLDIERDGARASYTIGADAYFEIGSPTEDCALDTDAFEVVCYEHESYLAIKRAYYYLSSRDRSRRELLEKLIGAGFSRRAALRAVLRLAELGYIDEDAQLERAVLREANTALRGPRLILERLCQKGYNRDDIRRVLERLSECGEIDFDANLDRLIQKKRVLTDEKKYALAYRYGYKF